MDMAEGKGNTKILFMVDKCILPQSQVSIQCQSLFMYEYKQVPIYLPTYLPTGYAFINNK